MNKTFVCEDCWETKVETEQENQSLRPMCDDCFEARAALNTAYKLGKINWDRFQYALKGASRRSRIDEVLAEVK
jgi:hypothetical protein